MRTSKNLNLIALKTVYKYSFLIFFRLNYSCGHLFLINRFLTTLILHLKIGSIKKTASYEYFSYKLENLTFLIFNEA